MKLLLLSCCCMAKPFFLTHDKRLPLKCPCRGEGHKGTHSRLLLQNREYINNEALNYTENPDESENHVFHRKLANVPKKHNAMKIAPAANGAVFSHFPRKRYAAVRELKALAFHA